MDSNKIPERRRILVTGATGKQGGAVVKALSQLSHRPNDFGILALTRKTSSTALLANPKVTLLQGDLDNALDIFKSAGGVGAIWGVFSVQVMDGKTDPYSDDNKEYRQGVDLIDAALKYGVKHFVQSSVDRGGEDSDHTPTNIPHFITKHRIEMYLKEKTQGSKMTYTILRPVAFMDMLTPDLGGRIMASLIAKLGDKPLQLVATKDIGIFAAQAFTSPATDEYKNSAISLAGDELTLQGCNDAFWEALHRPIPVAHTWTGSALLWMMSEMKIMFQWFKDNGYGADVAHCRKLNSGMLDLRTYLKEESSFVKRT